MDGRELSYVSGSDPVWKRLLMAAIEDLSGRRRLLPVYKRWRGSGDAVRHPRWDDLLAAVGTRLDIAAPPEYPHALPMPLVLVANHPFGIPDGVALMALAERIGRPFRILLHSDLMRIPEVARVGLPIDFSATPEAQKRNLKSRMEARRLLAEGVTILIFPAGGVATSDRAFGKAEELLWKPFVVRLVRQAHASVLPVYFDGQNSPLFHVASRISLSLRLALIVSEARRQIGREIRLRIGTPLSVSDIEGMRGNRSFLDELYVQVHRLAPDADLKSPAQLMPRAAVDRVPFAWETPNISDGQG